ncbi:hypothetical protein CA11_33200 [Gimesia maris]|nr:hypothetical protein CA11_33200 [Gimesia maris]
MNGSEELTGANKKYGYIFGCEGVVDYQGAFILLGVSSRDTVRNMAKRGLIRQGQHTGSSNAKAVFCRRSILEYLSKLEN